MDGPSDRPFSSERHRRDWLSYKRESRQAQGLTDAERVAQMRELYLLYLMFQSAKSAEQLAAEARAERRLNTWRLNPRYRELMEKAHGQQDAG